MRAVFSPRLYSGEGPGVRALDLFQICRGFFSCGCRQGIFVDAFRLRRQVQPGCPRKYVRLSTLTTPVSLGHHVPMVGLTYPSHADADLGLSNHDEVAVLQGRLGPGFSAPAVKESFFRPPYRTPLTCVPLRLRKSRIVAWGGLTSSRKWCRDT